MSSTVFYVDRLKWLVHHFKLVFVYALVAAIFTIAFRHTHDYYYLIFAVVGGVGGLVSLYAALATRPKVVLDNRGFKFGKEQFAFADVIDVKRRGEEYVFMLASRRRVVVKLTHFSEADKKSIDGILARECAKHLSSEEAREKIARANDISHLEFAFRAKRSNAFWVFLMIITAGMIMIALSAVLLFVLTWEQGKPMETGGLIVLLSAVVVWAVCFLIEKKCPKSEFSFRDDTFTLMKGPKVVASFGRGDVKGVGVAPQGQNYIVFRIEGRKKNLKVPLFPFARKDRKLLKESVKSIFFLPDRAV